MRVATLRRLPVVDQNKRLVGIMALADLALRADEPRGREALEGVSQPPETGRRD